jgi:hypothetical protein
MTTRSPQKPDTPPSPPGWRVEGMPKDPPQTEEKGNRDRAAVLRRGRSAVHPGGTGRRGQRRGPRPTADHLRVRRRPASRTPRRSWSRSSTSSRTPVSTPSSADASPRACCCPASPAPARRCWPGRSPARPTCRSSRCRRPSSSRWWSASAPAGCATCSIRPRQVAPAIIFIDELDAIGRAARRRHAARRHDEREQTLNQILTEMDGFTGAEGVIVIAATNRPEILDSALLRPGRFDRQVPVSPPDQVGAGSSKSTPATCRWATTSTSTPSPRPPRAWWAPTSRTSSTRPP